MIGRRTRGRRSPLTDDPAPGPSRAGDPLANPSRPRSSPSTPRSSACSSNSTADGRSPRNPPGKSRGTDRQLRPPRRAHPHLPGRRAHPGRTVLVRPPRQPASMTSMSIIRSTSAKREGRGPARAPSLTRTVAEAQYRDALRNRLDSLYTMYVDAQEAQERRHQAEADPGSVERASRRRRGSGRGWAGCPTADVDRFDDLAATRRLDALRGQGRRGDRRADILGFVPDSPGRPIRSRIEVERLRVAEWPIPAGD